MNKQSKTNNIDFTDALSNMITPNNQPTKKSSKQFKPKKPPPVKKQSKPKQSKPKQTAQKKISLQPKKNPNQLTPKQTAQVNQVNNTPPIKQKSKQQSQKDFKKAQLVSNDKLRLSLFSGVFDSINQEKEENNQPILTLQRFTTISNTIMKVINDMNYLIQDDDTITDLLVNKFDEITSQISSKSVNTQRKIITDIITILSSNQDTKVKDIKRYEYLRKKIQLDSKSNTQSANS
jgi:hypothetical protein